MLACTNAVIQRKTLKWLYILLYKGFDYHISINSFSVGKCISHSTRYKVNNKSLQRQTTYGRLLQNPSVVAMAITDRGACLVFFNLPDL